MSRTKTIYSCELDAFHLTPEQVKELGSVWTPVSLSMRMAKQMNWESGEVLDPCCGGGNLLCAMLDVYPELQEEDCYGIDIDPKAIEIARQRIPKGHFIVGDYTKINKEALLLKSTWKPKNNTMAGWGL